MLDSHDIEQRLSTYLGAPVARLSILASGWETTVFEFTLAAASKPFASIPVGEPMVLRFYQGSAADAKGAREHTTIDRLFAAGYPVPRPYAFEADHRALGAPFLIMQRLAGGPLFAVRSFPNAFKTFSMAFFSFVRTQSRLHKFDPASAGLREIPHAYAPIAGASADSPLLDRVLAIIANRVETGPLPGLREALNLVTERAPKFRRSPGLARAHGLSSAQRDGAGAARDRRDRLGEYRRRRSPSRRRDDRRDSVVVRAREAAMDARQPGRQRAARELRGAVHAALPCDGADGLRALPLLPGGRGPAAALDARDDARARSGSRWAFAARRSTKSRPRSSGC